MKITLAIVTSLDGKSTKGNMSPSEWASKEDQQKFFSLIRKYNLTVMGKNTYLIRKPYLKLTPGKLRVVMTRNPQQFRKDQVPTILEFSSDLPKKLVKRLGGLGFKQMLLVSGPKLNTAFFKDKLVDELLLTLEPKIFGKGKGLVDQMPLNVNLKLKSIKRLNQQGTLLLKYAVV